MSSLQIMTLVAAAIIFLECCYLISLGIGAL